MGELSAGDAATLKLLAEVNARIADLTEQADGLKDHLRALGPGTHTLAGMPVLRITLNRVFDTDAAALSLPEQVRTECLTTSYDAALVRAHLAPVDQEQFMVERGAPRVTVIA